MNRYSLALLVALSVLVAGFGCHRSSSSDDDPALALDPPVDSPLESTQFVQGIDNLHLPMIPGTGFVYEGETTAGVERVETFVSHLPREVDGVECTVLVRREFLDDELTRETFNWLAQDNAGNVWNFGEETNKLENGTLVSTEGSWEAGVDGAVAGILLKANPREGETYRQENNPGVAEDMAEVVALREVVILKNGVAYTCLKTREWDPLNPGSDEFRYYSPGVGLVLEESVDGAVRTELVERSADTTPLVDPAAFTVLVTNPHLPLPPGTTYTFEGQTDEGDEIVEFSVTTETREVMGVQCTQVQVNEYISGQIAEVSIDWFAQHMNGDVWYFGEFTEKYENGVAVSTEGSWEAGIDGAWPGIVMKAEPRVGDDYRQEYQPGYAEDLAVVEALDVLVTLSDGSQYVCVKTREWNTLEPGSEEFKYHAPGVGLVLETDAEKGLALELTKITID